MCWNMIEVIIVIFAINFMKEFSYNPFALLHVLLSSFILLPHIPLLKDFFSSHSWGHQKTSFKVSIQKLFLFLAYEEDI